MCEAQSGFALNAWIYTGKGREGGHKHLGKDVVLQLVEQFSGSGREIVTDNFFTSHELVVNLLQMNLTLLGTIRSHRREILGEIPNKNLILKKFICFARGRLITCASLYIVPKYHTQWIFLV